MIGRKKQIKKMGEEREKYFAEIHKEEKGKKERMIRRKNQRRNRGKKKIRIERRYSTLGGKIGKERENDRAETKKENEKRKDRMIGRKKHKRKMGEEIEKY
jgi:hypothetical protein